MSLDIRSHMPLAVDIPADEMANEKKMRRLEIALLVSATGIAVVLFSSFGANPLILVHHCLHGIRQELASPHHDDDGALGAMNSHGLMNQPR